MHLKKKSSNWRRRWRWKRKCCDRSIFLLLIFIMARYPRMSARKHLLSSTALMCRRTKILGKSVYLCVCSSWTRGSHRTAEVLFHILIACWLLKDSEKQYFQWRRSWAYGRKCAAFHDFTYEDKMEFIKVGRQRSKNSCGKDAAVASNELQQSNLAA